MYRDRVARRSGHQPRFDVVHGDQSAKRWLPRARLLFIVGASIAIWLVIALIVAIIIRYFAGSCASAPTQRKPRRSGATEAVGPRTSLVYNCRGSGRGLIFKKL